MLVFDKWDTSEVKVSDPGLIKYIGLDNRLVMHTFGVFSKKRFSKTDQNIVERLINKLMRSGQGRRKLGGKYIRNRNGTGKKLMIMKEVEAAFEMINARTKKNPVQLLVMATENSAPNEDVTRLKKGGVSYTESVDVAPYNKLNEALKNLALASFASTFNNKKGLAESLAEEIVSAAANDNKSYSIKRKDEIERIAKSSR